MILKFEFVRERWQTRRFGFESQAMRKTFIDTLILFAMLVAGVAAGPLLHWVMQLVVTEFGIFGALVACGIMYVMSLIFDYYEL